MRCVNNKQQGTPNSGAACDPRPCCSLSAVHVVVPESALRGHGSGSMRHTAGVQHQPPTKRPAMTVTAGHSWLSQKTMKTSRQHCCTMRSSSLKPASSRLRRNAAKTRLHACIHQAITSMIEEPPQLSNPSSSPERPQKNSAKQSMITDSQTSEIRTPRVRIPAHCRTLPKNCKPILAMSAS